MKILIVDDEILVRKGIVMSIDWKKLNFTGVFEASNGEEAYNIIQKEIPDLVLTDIKMPKIDGLELIELVSKNYPSIVIIVLSCINDGAFVRKALKYNKAIDYIPKLSMSSDEITEVVERAKNFIQKNQSEENIQILFNQEIINKIEEGISNRSEKELCNLILKCFETTDKNRTINNLIGWHDLLSIFTNSLREMGGDINSIILEDTTYYDYFYSAKNISQLEYRFVKFISIFLEYMYELECQGLNNELKKAVAYIRQNYKNDIKLFDVAKEIGLNETYFSRVFKKKFGINYSDYLNNVRLEKSKELLNTTNLTMNEISTEVGYNSESYFSRIFKLNFKITPKQFRKKQNTAKIYKEN